MSRTEGSTRDNLIQEAEILFSEKGFYGTSINDVAKTLGLTKQGLLHHFPTKEKLYGAVLEDAAGYLMEQLDGVLEHYNTPKEQLLGFFQSYSIDNVRLLRVTRLFMREIIDNRERADSSNKWYLAPFLKKFENVIETGQTEGQFADVNPTAFIYLLLGAQQYFMISLPTLKQIYSSKEHKAHLDNHVKEIVRILDNTLFL